MESAASACYSKYVFTFITGFCFSQFVLCQKELTMILAELSIVAAAVVVLAALRLGLPMLAMWLLNLFCCRVLRLNA